MAQQRSPASQLLLSNSLSLFKSGKLDKAEEFARKVLAAEPRNTELLQFIAVLCLEQGKPDEAIRLCTEAVRLKPNSGEAHYNLGTALLRQQRHEQAVASLRKSAALLSRNYDALNNLSLALLGSGKVAEAEATARRAIAQAPRLAAAHVSLGLALANQARFADAVESLKAALARGPKDPGDVMTKLGLVLLEAQQPQAAIDCLGQVVERDAKSLAALEGLAQAELLEGRFQDAARHFLAATKLAPDDARLLGQPLVRAAADGGLDRACGAHCPAGEEARAGGPIGQSIPAVGIGRRARFAAQGGGWIRREVCRSRQRTERAATRGDTWRAAGQDKGRLPVVGLRRARHGAAGGGAVRAS